MDATDAGRAVDGITLIHLGVGAGAYRGLSPWDLANAVTSFCTIGAGLTTLGLSRWVRPQPRRWIAVYVCLFVTGLPTLGWHGWGGEPWRVADVGTNLLLAFALQLAVLGDFYAPRTQRRVGVASGAVNALAVLWMAFVAARGAPGHALDFGGHGGFTVGEVVLILDALLVVGLIFARRRLVAEPARPLLHTVTAIFLLGLYLASASGATVIGRVGAYHALWHVLGGFGFVFFWAFTHVRLEAEAGRVPQPVGAAARAGAR